MKTETSIVTERLLLREMTLEDAEVLYSYWSDDEVTKHMNVSSFTSVDQAKEMIQLLLDLGKEDKACRYSIVLKETNEVIGTCGFNYIDREDNRAEIGFDLGRPFWKKGYAREGLEALVRYGFDVHELNRIEAKVEPENVNSKMVLNKLSFVHEGLLREHQKSKGKYVDLHIFSLLKKEYLEKK
ncbi:GNAT family N-acetyltransferase [Brevibacillus laterosporus]|uniref:GNAT family N-acetyltransferase n=1 Tax=Brevibacillus laterosporus TaxID=1465 RepID=UPI0018CE234B|nr:GNAT family protein [Brevibacillus laterosporus]MBG9786817.1 GNAT family acetyltransferase [Brevibacillus laterosporus]